MIKDFVVDMSEPTIKIKNNNGDWVTISNTIGFNGETIFCNGAGSGEISLRCDEQNNCICEEKCICEEEKEMNKIIQLYTERKEKEIHDKYDKLVEEEYNKIEFVEVYNNLVDAFEGALKELFEDETNVGGKYLHDSGLTDNVYKYCLMEGNIKREISKKYDKKKIEELEELHKFVKEVETMLSLADEGNGNIDKYKVEDILKNYGIIDENLKIQA